MALAVKRELWNSNFIFKQFLGANLKEGLP